LSAKWQPGASIGAIDSMASSTALLSAVNQNTGAKKFGTPPDAGGRTGRPGGRLRKSTRQASRITLARSIGRKGQRNADLLAPRRVSVARRAASTDHAAPEANLAVVEHEVLPGCGRPLRRRELRDAPIAALHRDL